MKPRLIACPACARHVRASDCNCACPFCGAAVPCAAPLRTIKGRLSRAAMHAAGAAGAVVAIADCSSSGNVRDVAFYGAACVDGSCITTMDAGEDAYDANTSVFYGAACPEGSCLPPVEAGNDAPADVAPDAGEDAADGGGGDAPADSSGTD